MLKNYFKTAIRSLARNKVYTSINVIGLAIGVAVCLIIFIVVQFERSFDDFHTNRDRIYRVITEFSNADGISRDAGVPAPVPQALRANFPELEKVSAVLHSDNNQVLISGGTGSSKKFKEERGLFFVEPEFFQIFDFSWLQGSPKSLEAPTAIALTQSTAAKYFGNWESAIGKTIRLNNRKDYTVTGVLKDVPDNTDFQIKMVAGFGGTRKSKSTDWVSVSSDMGSYVVLSPASPVQQLNERIKQFVKKHKPADVKHTQLLQSLQEVHFDAETGNLLRRTISKELIRGLLFIAAFILIIACVNFINLSTAQAVNRAKEVGVRKVLGSNKAHLRTQFLAETAIIVILSVLFAVAIAFLSLPLIENILQLPLSFSFRESPQILWFLLLLTPVVVVLAGFYPAIVLSRFNPIESLKSKMVVASTRGVSLRKVLVVVQFIIAQALIIGTLVIVQQMNFFRNKQLGFNKEAIVNLSLATDSASSLKLELFRNKLLQNPAVESVSFSYASPADNFNWNSNFWFGNAEKATDWDANLKWADNHYLETYNLQLLAGRNIKKSDTTSEFLVNETLLQKLGVADLQEALNKKIDLWDGSVKGEIVGVIKDFHSQSLQEEIPPLMIASAKENYYVAGIKLKPQQLKSGIGFIEKTWNELFPDYAFDYKFLDEKIASFYQQEKQLSQLYTVFAVIAIFLSCLGLYGLASFMAVQRIKEVGIRKVLGASVRSIVYLFSREFIILIGIAFIIAAPVAWYFMHQWLQDFVYRINISWWVLFLAGAVSLFIALITVSSKALKVALTNPVKNLRTE